jgi:alanyl-tRNA synthetase
MGATVNVGSPRELEGKVQSLVEENERLRREVAGFQSERAHRTAGEVLDRAETIDGVTFVAAEFPASSMDSLREAADELRDRMQSGVGVLGARIGDKAAFLAFVTDDVIAERGLRADHLVREVAKIAGGGGGGRPQLATAGGKNPEKLSEALGRAGKLFRDLLAAGKA